MIEFLGKTNDEAHLTQPTQAQQQAAVNYGHLGKVDGAPENGAAHSHRTHFPNRVRFLDGADNDSRHSHSPPQFVPRRHASFYTQVRPLDGADNDSRRGGISPQFVLRRHASFYTQVRPLDGADNDSRRGGISPPSSCPAVTPHFILKFGPSTVPTMTQGVAAFLPVRAPPSRLILYSSSAPRRCRQ